MLTKLLRSHHSLLSCDGERYTHKIIMPTPSLYRDFAKNNLQHKWRYLLLTGTGIFCSLFSMLLMGLFEINLLPIFGIGLLLIIWGWGLFLIIIWKEKPSKSKWMIINFFRICFNWEAAIFLNIWFFVGSLAILLFIISSIT